MPDRPVDEDIARKGHQKRSPERVISKGDPKRGPEMMTRKVDKKEIYLAQKLIARGRPPVLLSWWPILKNRAGSMDFPFIKIS